MKSNEIVLAIKAGCDIIAIANNTVSYDPEAANKAFNAIKAAVSDGRVTEQRIKKSYERVMQLKGRLT